MMYTAQEIAHYVVTKCAKDGCPISNLQLQKILYFLQVGVAKAGRGMAFGDQIEAWQFGPVVRSVYYEFGRYGGMPITDTFDDVQIADDDKKFLDPIIDTRRNQKAWELVKESHREGGPWAKHYAGPRTNNVIPLEDIIQYG